MNKVILGDGLLGKELINQSGFDYFSRKKNGLDICDKSTWENLLLPYDIIINCVAYTNTYDTDKTKNWNINYKAVSELVDYCNFHNKKLVHISTDYVYTNSDSFANEETTVPIHGNNWYSYTKLLADAYIELKSNNYLVIRETHKPYPFPYENAWIDQVGNFDYVNKIVELIIPLIENKNGIINIGTELKSIYNLAKKTKDVNPTLKPENVPSNTSMDLTKLNNII